MDSLFMSAAEVKEIDEGNAWMQIIKTSYKTRPFRRPIGSNCTETLSSAQVCQIHKNSLNASIPSAANGRQMVFPEHTSLGRARDLVKLLNKPVPSSLRKRRQSLHTILLHKGPPQGNSKLDINMTLFTISGAQL